MSILLIDTNILIDHLRGKTPATQFLQSCLLKKDILICSVITRIELMAGMRTGEELQIQKLLDIFDEIEVDKKTAETAGNYMNKYLKSHGINTADAIIAASAMNMNASLCTLNAKHFPMSDINIVIPYTIVQQS